MKVLGRRKSKNIIDARNTTGKNYHRTEAQIEEAFNPEQKRRTQRNTNSSLNKLASGKTGNPALNKMGKDVLKRRELLLRNPPTLASLSKKDKPRKKP